MPRRRSRRTCAAPSPAGAARPAALLDAVEDCLLWGLFDHAPLPRWVDGRLALLGDACHPMLPFLAQGATMALEDAWVLADCLDLADDPRGGLAAYEARAAGAGDAGAARGGAGSGRLYHLGPGLRGPVAGGARRRCRRVAPSLLAARFDWLFGDDVTATG